MTWSARGKFVALLFFFFFVLSMAARLSLPAEAAPGPSQPPRPQILDSSAAPGAARVLNQTRLSFDPAFSPRERDRDFLEKAARAKALLDLVRLVDLRHQALGFTNAHGQEPSWEHLRRQRFPNGDRVGVTLSAPVWVPSRARRVPTYAGFEKKWQTVGLDLPRPSGFVWFAPSLADINDKAHYRAERIQFETNSRFAPLAALLLEYIFREGWFDTAKRLPLVVVRSGEDTYAASAYSGPVNAECLSFPDEDGSSLAGRVVTCQFPNMADLHHGRHAAASNHRLGLALDLNDFNYNGNGVVDGPPNPVSRAARQFDRDAMHKLDARQLPAWVYQAAKWLGCRIPQEWVYFGYHTDWAHVDVGTK